MRSVTLRAFAKINLSLRVKAPRPDGYHDIQTVLQAVDLADRVTIAASRGPFEIRSDVSGVPCDRTNLVWKAASLLWQVAGGEGEPRGAVVTLEKRIPMQAGLGGGSSNAAAALLGLRRLWKLRVPDDQIYAMASQLGSDVPYFLVGGTALALGRGEEVYALEDLPRFRVVLVFPPFGVSTKDAYGWWDEDRKQGVTPHISWHSDEHNKKRGLTPFLRTQLVNDLEEPVVKRRRLIGMLKERLVATGALVAAMSGSGSTVFGVFRSEAAAASAARGLKKAGARVLVTRFQPRQRG